MSALDQLRISTKKGERDQDPKLGLYRLNSLRSIVRVKDLGSPTPPTPLDCRLYHKARAWTTRPSGHLRATTGRETVRTISVSLPSAGTRMQADGAVSRSNPRWWIFRLCTQTFTEMARAKRDGDFDENREWNGASGDIAPRTIVHNL